MKRNKLFEERRKAIPDEIRKEVSIAFDKLDHIHEIQISKDRKVVKQDMKYGKETQKV